MTPWLDLPYDIRDVTPEESRLIKKCLTGYTNFVKCGKNEYVMPGLFRKYAQTIYNLQVRSDDVWVITFPRSGTTWVQELIWLVQNNLDYEKAKQTPLFERFPMLETTIHIPKIAYLLIKANFMNLKNFQGLGHAIKKPSWKIIEDQPSPRFIKTHMPLSLLPPALLKTSKVVYVARDPRDVAVSYFYLHKMIMKDFIKTTFSEFWEAFMKGLLPWTPIVAHTNEAWMRRDEPNLHFVFYEDLIKELPKEIRKICTFLGKEYTDEEISGLAAHLSFNSLQKNKSVNNTTGEKEGDVQFIRKGEVGGWKAYFNKEMQTQAEQFLIEKLKGLDLSYPSFETGETTHL